MSRKLFPCDVSGVGCGEIESEIEAAERQVARTATLTKEAENHT